MKYIMIALSITSYALHSTETALQPYDHNTQRIPLISSNYKIALQALARKDIKSLKETAPSLRAHEQTTLVEQARVELENISIRRSIAKNSFRFLWGLGMTASGGLNFLLGYAANRVDNVCKETCDTITRSLPITDDPKLCSTLCSTISQDKLHVLALPAGTTVTATGLVVCGYSVYDTYQQCNNKKKLRTIIKLLQASDYLETDGLYSDSDTEDSDSGSAEAEV